MTTALNVFDIEFVIETIEPHFDAEFYAEEYPDLCVNNKESIVHFCNVGWREGRNPSPYFDTVSYLQKHQDVRRALMNPLFHYVVQGRKEGREVVPSITPSSRALLVFGYPLRDWVEAMRSVVDVSFYRSKLPSNLPSGLDPVAHFSFFGWRDGLSPSPRFRLADLLNTYPQAAKLQVNPLLAHLEAEAGRYHRATFDPETMSTPEPAPALVQTDARSAQIDIVRAEFDKEYYLSANADIAASGVDPLDHYFYTGWREGRNPTAEFDSALYLANNPDVEAAGVNPFWHFIAIGRAQGRLPPAPEAERGPSQAFDAADKIALIRTEFSVVHYLSENPDVAESGVDPVEHYFHTGWREGRNPNKQFDTRYYLGANEDVRTSEINPFWHYLVAGRAEGRAPTRPGGFRRQIIEAAKAPEARAHDWVPADGKPITKRVLTKRLQAAMADCRGFCVALSHDCYIRVIGGTQIFIADEQNAFAKLDYAYIQLSPRKPRLDLAPADPEFAVQIVVDGKLLGIASLRNVISVLHEHQQATPLPALLIVHSVLGFNEVDIGNLRDAIAPKHAIFWLHDYTSICEGFNLLRNDLAFCNAPCNASQACRVCVYGPTRPQHQGRIRRLFEQCDFDVLSPSHFALDLWKSRSGLPAVSAEVHPHWELAPLPIKRQRRKRGGAESPIRIAFVGFPSAGKGWHVFSNLADQFAKDKRYRFFHFGARSITAMPECEFVVTEVTPQDRHATTRLLREHEIDFLAMLSPWPETFSFVAHEGVAAGCQLLCFADSGNVAALVRTLNEGFIFNSSEELEEFFRSSLAVKAAQEARRDRRTFTVVNSGTTATVTRFFEDVTVL